MLLSHQRVRRVHVAEHLRPRRFAGLLAALDVDLRALLLALVAVENAQRNADAQPQRLTAVAWDCCSTSCTCTSR